MAACREGTWPPMITFDMSFVITYPLLITFQKEIGHAQTDDRRKADDRLRTSEAVARATAEGEEQ